MSEVPKGFVLVTLYPEKKKVLVPAGKAQGSREFPLTDLQKSKGWDE